MSRLTDCALALAMAAAILLGTATNRDTEADQVTADIATDRADESEGLQLAVYIAEHEFARSQHASAAQPTRRRHGSTYTGEQQ